MQYGASTDTGAEDITSGMVVSMSAGQLSSMVPEGSEATETRRSNSTASLDLHHHDTRVLSLKLPHDRAEGFALADAELPTPRQPSESASTLGQMSGAAAAAANTAPLEHDTAPRIPGKQTLDAAALPDGGEDGVSLLTPNKRGERSASFGSAPPPHFQLASRPGHATLPKQSPPVANRRSSERRTPEEDTLRAIVQVGISI